MGILKEDYGKTNDGLSVDLFTLTNKNGMMAKITNYGANLVSLFVPDKNGKLIDVVLGYGSLEGYFDNAPGLGSTIGRHANRIGGASFTLNGVNYQLEKNDGNNNLHGGFVSYNKYVYDAEFNEGDGNVSLELSRVSPDGEQGFPGNFEYTVTYTLSDDNELTISYFGVSDKDTVVNLTNHSYFNLSGHDSGDILDHKVMIKSNKFTITDKELITTGEVRDVHNTPMDFTSFKRIGDGIDSDYEPIVFAGGYDHNWILDISGDKVEKVAALADDKSGITMEVYTNKPGMQFYSANFLVNENGKDGATYTKRTGACFETQFFPNSTNIKEFPSPILKKGEEYDYVTTYKFLNV